MKLWQQRGFTLLEALLAITVFAMLSLMSWTVLSGVLRSYQESRQASRLFNDSMRAITLLTNDIDGMIPRQSRATNAVLSLSNHELILTTHNSDGLTRCCTPAMQTVRWSLQNGTLVRAIRYYPDNPKEQVLAAVVSGVTSMNIRYFQDEWHAMERKRATLFTRGSPLPKGLEISLTLENQQTITRRYLLPNPWRVGSPATETPAQHPDRPQGAMR